MSDQMNPADAVEDQTFADWDSLDWRERRARRFERWLNPAGVEFVDGQAASAYRERVQLLIDAIELRRPARVPLMPMIGWYAARWGGLTVREAMFEPEKLVPVWTRFHEEFQPDFQVEPYPPGRVFDIVGGRFLTWPGHGVGDDQPWQYVESEYMRPDEYDSLIADPSAYFMRRFLPRIADGFAPLASLDPFSDIMQPAGLPFNLIPFADPAVLEGVKRLSEAAEATLAYLETIGAATDDIAGRLGIPPFAFGLIFAPYDILADTLRGTKGIVMDRFRQPEKIIAGAERFVPLQIDAAVRQTMFADTPLVWIPLHKGADGFMSDADFREYYWPTLKAVARGLVDEGLVPLFFAEGGYNGRLEVIADPDLPAGSVVWWFDATDMAKAKRALGGYACVGGNVPGAMLAVGSAPQVEGCVTGLLDSAAKDGGFILGAGVMVDEAKAETVKAMIESGRRWS